MCLLPIDKNLSEFKISRLSANLFIVIGKRYSLFIPIFIRLNFNFLSKRFLKYMICYELKICETPPPPMKVILLRVWLYGDRPQSLSVCRYYNDKLLVYIGGNRMPVYSWKPGVLTHSPGNNFSL